VHHSFAGKSQQDAMSYRAETRTTKICRSSGKQTIFAPPPRQVLICLNSAECPVFSRQKL
jgi:hypothetical protein